MVDHISWRCCCLLKGKQSHNLTRYLRLYATLAAVHHQEAGQASWRDMGPPRWRAGVNVGVLWSCLCLCISEPPQNVPLSFERSSWPTSWDRRCFPCSARPGLAEEQNSFGTTVCLKALVLRPNGALSVSAVSAYLHKLCVNTGAICEGSQMLDTLTLQRQQAQWDLLWGGTDLQDLLKFIQLSCLSVISLISPTVHVLWCFLLTVWCFLLLHCFLSLGHKM